MRLFNLRSRVHAGLSRLARLVLGSGLLLAVLQPYGWVKAQEEQPKGPVYVVQEGDTLGAIARRFRVSVPELIRANDIRDPNLLSAGARLVIPGLEGIEGELTTVSVPFGETLRSLSRRYQVPEAILARLNHLTSPQELYVGYTLVIPVESVNAAKVRRLLLAPGQSLLELAALSGVSPWALVRANGLRGLSDGVPGETLLLPADSAFENNGPASLPEAVLAVKINPLPLRQGKTAVITISAAAEIQLQGSFMDRELHFFPDGAGKYVALQGVHAMAEPGFYPLTLQGVLADGRTFALTQRVGVGAINYPYDRPLQVDEETLDPAVTRPEEEQWKALTTMSTPQRLWDGIFRLPSTLPEAYCLETNDCWSSRFGNRRSYNGSAYIYYHTGLDIVGKIGADILAPAPGVVVFAGPLRVRGNATIIDHGWGVYTAYLHQSEILVRVGERVETGQLIGRVGNTGRVEGPHLHWEVWVGGIPVDPLDWLKQPYP